jgi:hypothetical protein
MVSGKTYRLKFKITTSGFARLNFTNNSSQALFFPNGNSVNNFNSGEYTFYLLAQNNSTALKIFAYNNSVGTSFSIDNVSVKEVTEADFDFTRGTIATRIAENGLIEDVTDTNLPRIDYTDGTGSLLLEPQSTNLLTYSEDFSFWSSNEVTTQTGFLAPDGSNNALKVTKDGGSGILYLNSGLTTTTTRTIYAKTVSGTGTVNLLSHNSNTNNLFTVTPKWQRFEVNSSNSTGLASFYAVDFRGSSTLSEVIIWGAQAEDLSFATSYIPTSGSTVTRDADVCNNAGSSDLINSTEGVLYAEIAALADDGTSRCIALSDGSTSNRVNLLFDTSNNAIRSIVVSGSSTQFDQEYVVSSTTNYHKAAIKYKANDFALWINGVERFTDTIGSTPIGLNDLSFNVGNGSLSFFGNVKSVAVFKEALTDEELTALTT